MIQLNLLPDIKQKFIKTRRLRRRIMGIAGLLSIGSLAVVAFMFLTANVWQSSRISGLDEDIESRRQEVESTPDIAKILTVQNQLDSLDQLHLSKTSTSRLFGYLEAVLPSDVSVVSVELEHDDLTVELEGESPNFEQVNKLVDTMKFTDYVTTSDDQSLEGRAFSNVVIRDTSPSDSGVIFTVTAEFDSILFDNSYEEDQIGINVPEITTTRSTTERPNDVFENSSSGEDQ